MGARSWKLKPENWVSASARLRIEPAAEVSQLTGASFYVEDTAVPSDVDICGSFGACVRFGGLQNSNAVLLISKGLLCSHVNRLVLNGIAETNKSAWVANYLDAQRGGVMVVAEHDCCAAGVCNLSEPG